MEGWLQDPMTFYTIAFAIFLVLAFKYGRKPMLDWIDSGIIKIRNDVDQARKLRAEAEAMLVEYKKRQAEAMAEAEAIVSYAKEEAVRLKAEADANLKALLAKHEQLAAERIRLAEADAIAEVRNVAIDLAMHMARTTLQTKIDDAAASKLIEQAIADMPKLAGEKAKAA